MSTLPGGTELHDHVRAFVGRPDVVVAVDAHGVREREAVQVLADLADERSVGSELEQLRRRLRRARVLRVAGATEDEEVSACESIATPATSPR